MSWTWGLRERESLRSPCCTDGKGRGWGAASGEDQEPVSDNSKDTVASNAVYRADVMETGFHAAEVIEQGINLGKEKRQRLPPVFRSYLGEEREFGFTLAGGVSDLQ